MNITINKQQDSKQGLSNKMKELKQISKRSQSKVSETLIKIYSKKLQKIF